MGNNRCPLFTMLTKQNISNVLHSKLCKEKEKEKDLIILGDLPLLKKIGLLSRATCPHTLTGLFSRATFPHMFILVYFQGQLAHALTLVYFHGRPAHTFSSWSIFRATGPNSHTVYFHGRPALKLVVVYFHGRPAHT
jgi:hypothetical protein